MGDQEERRGGETANGIWSRGARERERQATSDTRLETTGRGYRVWTVFAVPRKLLHQTLQPHPHSHPTLITHGSMARKTAGVWSVKKDLLSRSCTCVGEGRSCMRQSSLKAASLFRFFAQMTQPRDRSRRLTPSPASLPSIPLQTRDYYRLPTFRVHALCHSLDHSSIASSASAISLLPNESIVRDLLEN